MHSPFLFYSMNHITSEVFTTLRSSGTPVTDCSWISTMLFRMTFFVPTSWCLGETECKGPFQIQWKICFALRLLILSRSIPICAHTTPPRQLQAITLPEFEWEQDKLSIKFSNNDGKSLLKWSKNISYKWRYLSQQVSAHLPCHSQNFVVCI